MTHPLYLFIFFMPCVLRAVRLVPQEVPGPLWFDLVFLLLRLAVYVWLVVQVESRIQRWGFARNIPFVISHYLFFLPLAVLSYVVVNHIYGLDHSLVDAAIRIGRQQSFVLMMHVMIVAYFGPQIAVAVGRVPGLVPIWHPLRLPALADVSAREVGADLDGDLLTIQAQNQYVLVRSTEGEVLLRKPLRQALAGLPGDAGVQVHRSWWVSNRFLRQAQYDARGQELHIPDAPAVPVSKTHHPALQERLGQLK